MPFFVSAFPPDSVIHVRGLVALQPQIHLRAFLHFLGDRPDRDIGGEMLSPRLQGRGRARQDQRGKQHDRRQGRYSLDYVKEHQHSSHSSFEKTRLRILPKQESPIGHAYDQASVTILS